MQSFRTHPLKKKQLHHILSFYRQISSRTRPHHVAAPFSTKCSPEDEIRGSNRHYIPNSSDSFLHGSTTHYIDEMYRSWQKDPTSVHISWQTYFHNMEDPRMSVSSAFQLPPSLMSGSERAQGMLSECHSKALIEALHTLEAKEIVHKFQKFGHLHAQVNPLGSLVKGQPMPVGELQDPRVRTGSNLDQQIPIESIFSRIQHSSRDTMSLQEISTITENVYCGTFSVEFVHISDPEKRDWLAGQLEELSSKSFTSDEKSRILDSLMRGTLLERFVASKFPNEKRFGLDGLETLAPGLEALVDRCVDAHGVRDITLSQCHRGRLNTMSTVYGRDMVDLFRDFAGVVEPGLDDGHSGDVKYHLGFDGERRTLGGNAVAICVLPNPSHLEATGPVAQGKTRANQDADGSSDKIKSMCLALHTDAAFSGQGVVYETLNLSKLRGYEVGGTVRIIVNNQVGFTTDADSARSTRYCSDLAKFIEAPIFHVNADDPEAVVTIFRLAADWKAQFHSDVIVDLVCYRRFGHNEMDQPSFTQPEMYERISKKRASLDMYMDKLVADGTISESQIEQLKQSELEFLEEKFTQSKERHSFTKHHDTDLKQEVQTSVDGEQLVKILNKLTSVPESFKLHKNVKRLIEEKKKNLKSGIVDWPTAESLAFGSLLAEGTSVRLSGQDVERGTFSQRHSVLHDQVTYEKFTPLNNLDKARGNYVVFNSPLSEYSVLGFEYGYSLSRQNSLVIWEAQFGDFLNNAQVVLDQFISSGEAKWLLRSNLILSLPHGYDGQGPEHSSARIGRILELCNEPSLWATDIAKQIARCNVQVVYPTTAANLFHALRRQAKQVDKKPLILLFSKSLLRNSLTHSSFNDLIGASSFQPVIDDLRHERSPALVHDTSRIIFCSGQVYLSLYEHCRINNISDTAIIRIEQLHPFPWEPVKEIISQYSNAKTVVWCQEEPYNGGAWQYVRDRFDIILSRTDVGGKEVEHPRKLIYIGRPSAAAVATGSKRVHMNEQAKVVRDAFSCT